MKIGFLIQNLSSGGAERATVSLCNMMATKGENPEIITFDSESNFYTPAEDVTVVNMNLQPIEKKQSFKRIISCIKRAFEIRRKIKERNLDVLVCMSSVMNLYGLLSCMFTKTKVVGTERNNPYKYKADRINAFLKKLSAKLVDGFVFQTYAAAEYYAPSVLKKGTVIQNAVFNPLVYEIEPSEEKRKIIYGVGRLSGQKNFEILIDAFKEVKEKHSDYKLIIFGEGEKREVLQQRIDSCGLTKDAFLVGTNKDALRYVAQGSAFVLSSDYEGMPNVLMEALGVGTPCVSTRCKMGPEELITDGENGILTSVGSASELAQGINKIIENPDLAQKLSENGRKILSTNSVPVITDKWIEYLKSLKE